MNYFSKITNKLFYIYKEGTLEEGEKRKEYDGILKLINDNKVILVMHELYLSTTLRGKAILTLDYLIEKCEYKADKDSRKSFKYILNKLKELGYIDFDEINKSNEIIEIDTTNLQTNGEYFVVEDDELELIKSIAEDKKEYLNLVKIYCYLKARVHKGNDVRMGGGKAQTTFNSYEDIAEHTLISERNIKKYIDKLQDIKLIRYDNLGYKYKVENKNYKTECANIYVLTKISTDEDWIKADLTEGMKQQEYYYEEKGYIVTKKGYKNNNKKLNGLYGSLIKKEKNNTLTEEEKEELYELRLVKEIENNTIDELISK